MTIKSGQPERAESRQVLKEYREHRNPEPDPDIDVVWVISGWSVYDPFLSPKFKSVAEGTIFEDEDRRMIDLGVDLVHEITALRLGKPKQDVTKEDIKLNGPTLLYNGNIDQNENLRLAAEHNEFSIPQEKLRIEKLADDRDPKHNNTNKQFEKFPKDLLSRTKKMAVVAYLWHLARIERNPLAPSLIAKEPQWEDIKFLYFAADRPGSTLPHDQKSVAKRAIEIRKKVMDEGRKIYAYTEKGDLAG